MIVGIDRNAMFGVRLLGALSVLLSLIKYCCGGCGGCGCGCGGGTVVPVVTSSEVDGAIVATTVGSAI